MVAWPVRPSDLPGLVPMDQGWMADVEVSTIAMAAILTRATRVAGDVLEVGCYWGRTTSGLLHVCADASDRVVVVDTFMGGKDLPEEDVEESFHRNLRAHFDPSFTADRLEVRRGPSAVELPKLRAEGRRFRVIVVDADHDEEPALQDLRDCWPMLSLGGFLFLDDVDLTGVGRSLERFMREGVADKGLCRLDMCAAAVTRKILAIRKVAPPGAT